MKSEIACRCIRRIFSCVLFMLIISGCSSTPKIDWDQRVGNYTFDQAVIDLGPPDKSADLDDGSRIAEWFMGRGPSSRISFGIGTGFSSGNTSVGVGQSVGTGRTYVNALRLTFDSQGTLTQWANVSH